MAATTLDCGELIVLILTNSVVNFPARSQAARQLNGSINPETWPSASYATIQDLGFTDRNGLNTCICWEKCLKNVHTLELENVVTTFSKAMWVDSRRARVMH